MNSFTRKISRSKRVQLLQKFIYWKQIDDISKKHNIQKGTLFYVLEYLKLHPNQYVRIKDVCDYCNEQSKTINGHSLGDSPRSFHRLRNDIVPSEWSEIKYKQMKFIKYHPKRMNRKKKLSIPEKSGFNHFILFFHLFQ
jgi:hypothetical protein